jgi:hopanoid biosynthesis associated protein HpnK
VTRLIVNADDFGLTPGVNRAILELHRAGVLSSATLMARAPATDEAITLARATPTLGVGCHVVLVDGEPVLPAAQLPTLVDPRTGHFHPTPGTFLTRLFTGRIRAAEIEAEAAAQIRLLQGNGLALTHIDTHKHTHMFPPVLRAVLRAAGKAGIRRVRNPFEPEWAVRATPRASLTRAAEVVVLRRLWPYFRRLIEQQEFVTTDGTIAVAGTGVLDAAMVRSLMNQLPAGTWELVTHPGYNDADLARIRTRLRASREIERDALHTLKEIPNLELVSFAALGNASRGGASPP